MTQVCQQYKDAGIQDVQIKLYPGDRHEILNETDRDVVYADILTWLNGHHGLLTQASIMASSLVSQSLGVRAGSNCLL